MAKSNRAVYEDLAEAKAAAASAGHTKKDVVYALNGNWETNGKTYFVVATNAIRARSYMADFLGLKVVPAEGPTRSAPVTSGNIVAALKDLKPDELERIKLILASMMPAAPPAAPPAPAPQIIVVAADSVPDEPEEEDTTEADIASALAAEALKKAGKKAG